MFGAHSGGFPNPQTNVRKWQDGKCLGASEALSVLGAVDGLVGLGVLGAMGGLGGIRMV